VLTGLIKFVVAEGISLLILNMMDRNVINFIKIYSTNLRVILKNICAYDDYMLIYNTAKHKGMSKMKLIFRVTQKSEPSSP
jgi:hypothetical protein